MGSSNSTQASVDAAAPAVEWQRDEYRCTGHELDGVRKRMEKRDQAPMKMGNPPRLGQVWRLAQPQQANSCWASKQTQWVYFPVSEAEAAAIASRGLTEMMTEFRSSTPSVATFWHPVVSMKQDKTHERGVKRLLCVAELRGGIKNEHTLETPAAAPPLSESDKALRVYVYNSESQLKQLVFLGEEGSLMGRPAPIIFAHPSRLSVKYIAEYDQGGGFNLNLKLTAS